MAFPFHPPPMIWTPLIRKSLRAAQRRWKFPWNPETIESYPYLIWATSGQGCPASSWPQNFISKVNLLCKMPWTWPLKLTDSIMYMYDLKTSYKGQLSISKFCICIRLVGNLEEWSEFDLQNLCSRSWSLQLLTRLHRHQQFKITQIIPQLKSF